MPWHPQPPTGHGAVLREALFASIWNKFDVLSEFTATHSRGYHGNQWGIANKNRKFYGDAKVLLPPFTPRIAFAAYYILRRR